MLSRRVPYILRSPGAGVKVWPYGLLLSRPLPAGTVTIQSSDPASIGLSDMLLIVHFPSTISQGTSLPSDSSALHFHSCEPVPPSHALLPAGRATASGVTPEAAQDSGSAERIAPMKDRRSIIPIPPFPSIIPARRLAGKGKSYSTTATPTWPCHLINRPQPAHDTRRCIVPFEKVSTARVTSVSPHLWHGAPIVCRADCLSSRSSSRCRRLFFCGVGDFTFLARAGCGFVYFGTVNDLSRSQGGVESRDSLICPMLHPLLDCIVAPLINQ